MVRMRLDDVCRGIERVVPDAFHDGRARDDASPVAHQVLEQLVFERLKLDGRAVPEDGVGDEVHLEGTRPKDAFAKAVDAAENRLQAGDEFGDGEGLAEVVVGPGLESGDLLVRTRARAQDDNRNHRAFRPPGAHDLESVHRRQHDVHDGRVERVAVEALVAGPAVRLVRHDGPDLPERRGDEPRRPHIVLYQKNLHRARLYQKSACYFV